MSHNKQNRGKSLRPAVKGNFKHRVSMRKPKRAKKWSGRG
jgi:hypothetical protein